MSVPLRCPSDRKCPPSAKKSPLELQAVLGMASRARRHSDARSPPRHGISYERVSYPPGNKTSVFGPVLAKCTSFIELNAQSSHRCRRRAAAVAAGLSRIALHAPHLVFGVGVGNGFKLLQLSLTKTSNAKHRSVSQTHHRGGWRVGSVCLCRARCSSHAPLLSRARNQERRLHRGRAS